MGWTGNSTANWEMGWEMGYFKTIPGNGWEIGRVKMGEHCKAAKNCLLVQTRNCKIEVSALVA